MKTIHKYEFMVNDTVQLTLPVNAEILAIRSQYEKFDVLTLWAKVDLNAEGLEMRVLRIIGTGHTFDDVGLEYLDTVLVADDSLVWHIFEIVRGPYQMPRG
jgi:hypothetical protein